MKTSKNDDRNTVRSTIAAAGSLWLAALILLLLMVAMGTATIHESSFGTEQASLVYYQSWWFHGLLALLCVNTIAAIISRLPINRKRLPFMVIHLGLVLILAGAFITQKFGVDGRISIIEQTSESAISIPGEEVTIRDMSGAVLTKLDLSRAIGDPMTAVEGLQGSLKHGDVTIQPIRYMPDMEWQIDVNNNNPVRCVALDLALVGVGPDIRGWIVAGEPEQLGPHQVLVRDAVDEFEWNRLSSPVAATGLGRIVVTVGEKTVDIPVENARTEPAAIGDSGLKIKVVRYYPHATVDPGHGIKNASDQPINPALEMEITGAKGRERRFSFARFPNFMHGKDGLIYKDVKVNFQASSRPVSRFPVEVIIGPENKMKVRFTGRGASPQTDSLVVGRPVLTPWPGQRLVLHRAFENARKERVPVQPAPIRKQRRPALLLRLSQGDAKGEEWVHKFAQQQLGTGENSAILQYGEKSVPLGFAVTLNRFKVGYYPGTQRPRTFESRITITDPESGLTSDRTISMNRPTGFRGYTFFQSSYQNVGDRMMSVLSVSRDPGKWIVYLGYFLTMAGMLLFMITRARRTAAVAVACLALTSLTIQAGDLRSMNVDAIRGVAVQHEGRYMPLDTLARALVSEVTGSERPGGKDPVLMMLDWIFKPEQWQKEPVIPIRNREVRKELGLPAEQEVYSYDDLVRHEKLRMLMDSLAHVQGKLDPLQTKVAEIQTRLLTLREVFRGGNIHLIPDAQDNMAEWRSLNWMCNTRDPELQNVRDAWLSIDDAFMKEDSAAFTAASADFKNALRKLPSAYYPSTDAIALELKYNRIAPFRIAWIIMAISACLATAGLFLRRRWFDVMNGGLMCIGFAMLTYGMQMRGSIAGRLPAANMFESLLFLSWGAAAFAVLGVLIFRKRRSLPLTAACIGAISLCLADVLPINHFIRPIAPVLMDTMWMSIHVPVIMVSYAVLAVAVLVAHVQVLSRALAPQKLEFAREIDQLLYWYIHIGSFLLLVGIVTGSMWAASSWGRYWGWDPKEVWSLVALLGYLTILHVRVDKSTVPNWLKAVGLVLGVAVFAIAGGKLRPMSAIKVISLLATAGAVVYFLFARSMFATAAKSILAFWMIIMTYVGVNYVLGTGLHSYGFGAGAVARKMLWIGGADLILVVACAIILQLRQSNAPAEELGTPMQARES